MEYADTRVDEEQRKKERNRWEEKGVGGIDEVRVPKNERKAGKKGREEGVWSEGQPRLGGFPEDRLFDSAALTLQCV